MVLCGGCKMSAQTDQKECEGYKEYNAGMNMLFQEIKARNDDPLVAEFKNMYKDRIEAVSTSHYMKTER